MTILLTKLILELEMKNRFLIVQAFLITTAMLLSTVGQVQAGVMIEDFEAPFPTWESAWLGTNSNLQNYYGVGQGRGNNPDGLWIQDGLSLSGETRISFNPVFAASLTSLSIDVTTFRSGLTFQIFDKGGVTLISSPVTQNNGAYTDPGSYVQFGVTSSSGIGGFRFLGSGIEGNTSIDNVVVNSSMSNVPEPTSLAIFGMIGLVACGRRRKS